MSVECGHPEIKNKLQSHEMLDLAGDLISQT